MATPTSPGNARLNALLRKRIAQRKRRARTSRTTVIPPASKETPETSGLVSVQRIKAAEALRAFVAGGSKKR
jgi:hypothetical protein